MKTFHVLHIGVRHLYIKVFYPKRLCPTESQPRPINRHLRRYNDNVIYPDKVRLNKYYYEHYSFLKDGFDPSTGFRTDEAHHRR